MVQSKTLSKPKNSYLIPIIIIGVLFFIFGFLTWVNSTLIPYLQLALELSISQAVWVTFAFYISYVVMAFPSSWVLGKVGLKNGMMYGLIVMAIGALIFIPAANARVYGLFLTGLFVIGTGLALLQTASNPYVTILGPIESAAKRISIMGIANKGAGALAPLIMGAIMLKDVDGFALKIAEMDVVQKATELDLLASRVIVPYAILAVVLTVLAFAVKYSKLPDINSEEETNKGHVAVTKDRKHWWNYPYLLLGFIAIFLYVGVEVIAGDMVQVYGEYMGLKFDQARHLTTYLMLFMMVGYLVGIALIPKYIKQEKALTIGSILGIVFTLGAIFTTGKTSVAFIVLLGFAHAPLWPAIWPLAIDGLGKHLKTGSALLIIGIGGGAVIPQLWARIGEAKSIGLQNAFWIMIPCYLFLIFYAVKGNKIGKDVGINNDLEV